MIGSLEQVSLYKCEKELVSSTNFGLRVVEHLRIEFPYK